MCLAKRLSPVKFPYEHLSKKQTIIPTHQLELHNAVLFPGS